MDTSITDNLIQQPFQLNYEIVIKSCPLNYP